MAPKDLESMSVERTRECPACALEGPADADTCPFCGYEYPPRPTRTLVWAAIVMAALLAWPVIRILSSLF